MWTPLGPTQSVLIKGVSLFQGLFDIRKILSGPLAVARITVDVLISGVPTRQGSTVLACPPPWSPSEAGLYLGQASV